MVTSAPRPPVAARTAATTSRCCGRRRAPRRCPGRARRSSRQPRLPTMITARLARGSHHAPAGSRAGRDRRPRPSGRLRRAPARSPPSAQASGSAKAARAAAVAGRRRTRLTSTSRGGQRDELAVGAVDEQQILAEVGAPGPAERAAPGRARSWRRPRGRPRARRARRPRPPPPGRRTRGRRRWARAGSSPGWPRRSVFTSVPQVSAASIRSTTSPAPGSGTGTCSSRRSPGP